VSEEESVLDGLREDGYLEYKRADVAELLTPARRVPHQQHRCVESLDQAVIEVSSHSPPRDLSSESKLEHRKSVSNDESVIHDVVEVESEEGMSYINHQLMGQKKRTLRRSWLDCWWTISSPLKAVITTIQSMEMNMECMHSSESDR